MGGDSRQHVQTCQSRCASDLWVNERSRVVDAARCMISHACDAVAPPFVASCVNAYNAPPVVASCVNVYNAVALFTHITFLTSRDTRAVVALIALLVSRPTCLLTLALLTRRVAHEQTCVRCSRSTCRIVSVATDASILTHRSHSALGTAMPCYLANEHCATTPKVAPAHHPNG